MSATAIYEIVVHPDGSSAVEVRRPGGNTEMVTGFAGKAEAGAWIAKQQSQAGAARGGAGAHHQRYTRSAGERDDRGPPKTWRR